MTMGVPRHFPTSTENSMQPCSIDPRPDTRLSYDNAYVQKTPTKTHVTPGLSVAPTFKPTHYSNRTNVRNSCSDRDRAYIRKRFQELFLYLSSSNLTNDYSSLYQILLPTKIDLVIRETPTWKYYLSAPKFIFCVLTVLKIFLCYQRLQRSENFSRRRFSEEQKGPSVLGTDPQETTETSPLPAPTSTSPIIIDPAFSTQNNSDSYLPPSYSPCAVNNIGAGNKIVDNTSEDLLPPYSTCVDALNDADGIPKIHKGESVEKQSCTETDINLNNSHTTDRNNVEQLDSTVRPVNRTVKTAIDVDEFNNLIENNNGTDEESHQVVNKYEDISLLPSSLRIFYANLCSIRKDGKFDEIKCILKAIKMTTHLLIFTETWNKSETDAKLYQLPNYNHIYSYRQNRRGGGVSIYVHDGIKYDIKEELCENGNHYLWLYINDLSLHIGAIYKPGSTNIDNFLKIYSLQLERRSNERSLSFGDINLDLLQKKSEVLKYQCEIQEAGYRIVNKIDKTYITREKTRTILDHVCTNIKNNFKSLSIIDSSLSDHKQIYLQVGGLEPQLNNKKQYKALDFEKLYNNPLEAKYNSEGHDYYHLETFISQQIEKSKILNPPQKDWIDQEIINSINERNKLGQQTKLDPENVDIRKKFQEEKEKVEMLINKHKGIYYYNQFSDCRNQPNKMWDLINNLGLNTLEDSVAPPNLMSNPGLLTESNSTCDLFNSFFSSIGADLVEKIPDTYHNNTGNTLMYDNKYTHDITLHELTPCTTKEIKDIIDDLDSNTSTGLDGISIEAIKCLKNIIAEPLTNCINDCLLHGIFPDTLKVARVSPVYKSGSRTDPSNYRPVSVLPVMSKIFESVLYRRLINYLTDKKFLIDEQYGFRPKSSTLTAATDLVTKIKIHVDEKGYALGIFIDLKKAFATVSHKKLLQKLDNIGIIGTAHKMFGSFMENRRQIVKMGDSYCSSVQNVSYGCPQDSIISPLLFLIYVNNINKIGLTGHLKMYADDIVLFYFDNLIENIKRDAQHDLDILNEWLKYNLLTIDTSKTSFIIFRTKNKKINDSNNALKINNDIIKQSTNVKYLGLWLDEKLTWKVHIDHLKKKLKSSYTVLWKVKKYIPSKTRVPTLIYNSLIKSHLEYLIEIWGTAAVSNLKSLQSLQNKIIRRLFHHTLHTLTKTIYEKKKVLNISQLYIYNTCILVKNITTNSIHTDIKLKENTELEPISARTNYGKKTILFEGVQLFNKFSADIKECDDMNTFKKKLKKNVRTQIKKKNRICNCNNADNSV